MTHRERVFIRNMRKHLRQYCRQLPPIGGPPLLQISTKGMSEFERALATVADAGKNMIVSWASEIVLNRRNYEPLFSMPPARVKKRKGQAKPQTLVERRAMAAASKVREWQRKAKLAATKVRAYQRKHKYYKRKGVV